MNEDYLGLYTDERSQQRVRSAVSEPLSQRDIAVRIMSLEAAQERNLCPCLSQRPEPFTSNMGVVIAVLLLAKINCDMK